MAEFDFLKALTNNAQAGLAKYGGYNSLPFFSALVSGVSAALPNSPFFSALNGFNQARNVQGYNRYLQGLEQQRAQDEKADNQASVTAQVGPLPGYAGRRPLSPQEVDVIRENQWNPDLNEGLQTGKLRVTSPYAKPNMELIRQAFERSGNLMDRQKTLEDLQQWMGQPLPGGGMGKVVNVGNGQQMTLETDPALVAQVTRTQPIAPGEAFTMGVADPSVLLTGRQNEQTDRRGNRTINETIRHNLKNENRIPAQNARDLAAADLARRTDPNLRRGGSGNPYTTANAQQTFIEGQIKAIDNQLQSLGYFNSKTKVPIDPQPEKYSTNSQWFDGKTAQTPQQLQKRQQAARLIEQRNQLQATLSDPFGMKAQQNLNAVPMAFRTAAEWKQGR